MNDEDIVQLFFSLAVDLNDLQFVIDNRPLLAHYTSISVLESIMKYDEIWFSNPLHMNDLEEVRFGIFEGIRLFNESPNLKSACMTEGREKLVRQHFHGYARQFETEHAFDTYVFCLSLHDPENMDGLLSMWRGYGGQGSGAALVFRTDFIKEPDESSPLVLTKVLYETAAARRTWLDDKIDQWCRLLQKLFDT